MLRNIPMRLQTLSLCLTLVFAAVMPASASELVARFLEGTHYQKIPNPVPTQAAAGQVEVTEVFSYGCIHCYNFDPMVEAWHKAQDNVTFQRVPAVFNPSWEVLAKAYYIAEALGVAERMHGPLFRAIHDKPVNIGDPKLMGSLFNTEAGISPDAFKSAFESLGVRGKVGRAKDLGPQLGLRAVPSMVVDGQYVIDSSMVAGGNAGMLEVVDFLVSRTLFLQNKSDQIGAAK
jgi:thiol:disulfide interchange protein DsbA